jgi:hypothetical protein
VGRAAPPAVTHPGSGPLRSGGRQRASSHGTLSYVVTQPRSRRLMVYNLTGRGSDPLEHHRSVLHIPRYLYSADPLSAAEATAARC